MKKYINLCCPLLTMGRGKPTECLKEKCSFWYEGMVITACAIVCIAQAIGSIGLVQWSEH